MQSSLFRSVSNEKKIIQDVAKRESLVRANTFFFCSLLFLGFYYLSYRYPFMINSSDTSPSYSDTPLALQLGKYLLYAGALGLTILTALAKRIEPMIRPEIPAILYLSMYPILSTVQTDFMREGGIFYSALLIPCLIRFDELDFQKLSRWVTFFFYAAFVVDAYQFINYQTSGRLPALGYGGTAVRFGSIWDDPNGFAFILAFLLPFYLMSKHSKLMKLFMTAATLVMLVLTQSLTGMFSFIVGSIVAVVILGLAKRNMKGILIMALLLIPISGGLYGVYKTQVEHADWFIMWKYSKAKSIEIHVDGATSASFEDYLYPLRLDGFKGKYAESGFVNMALNFGFIYPLLYLGISGLTIWRLVRKIKEFAGHRHVGIYYGALVFMIAYLIGMTNLPNDVVFPLNLFFVLCIMISYVKPKSKEAF